MSSRTCMVCGGPVDGDAFECQACTKRRVESDMKRLGLSDANALASEPEESRDGVKLVGVALALLTLLVVGAFAWSPWKKQTVQRVADKRPAVATSAPPPQNAGTRMSDEEYRRQEEEAHRRFNQTQSDWAQRQRSNQTLPPPSYDSPTTPSYQEPATGSSPPAQSEPAGPSTELTDAVAQYNSLLRQMRPLPRQIQTTLERESVSGINLNDARSGYIATPMTDDLERSLVNLAESARKYLAYFRSSGANDWYRTDEPVEPNRSPDEYSGAYVRYERAARTVRAFKFIVRK